MAGSEDLAARKTVYWHRELPPLSAEPLGEHVVEAASRRVANTFAHRDEIWADCYDDLMTNAHERIEQELKRLGGDCAHVLDQSVDSRSDDRTSEAWIHGHFTYMLFKNGVKS